MINVRKSDDRGHFDHGWLDTRHTFSFADYYDPNHMGFRSLRVINEDRVAPGEGFPAHQHRDMEILSVVLKGALEHHDSMGNGSIIRPGEVQRMSAGAGVTHSESNPSADEPVHFLQIWILPEARGIKPGYEQRLFTADGRKPLQRIASRNGTDGAVAVHQDVELYRGRLSAGKEIEHVLASGRHGWVQMLSGDAEVNGQLLTAGDGAAISAESSLRMTTKSAADLLLFDLG